MSGRFKVPDEKSDKILQNLAQVQNVIEDVKEEVHRIQRETPYPVPVRFRVYGTVAFPIDMLRYDNCVPDDEPDSARIEQTFDVYDDYKENPVFVTLRKLTAGEPSYERWASMGWKVET